MLYPQGLQQYLDIFIIYLRINGLEIPILKSSVIIARLKLNRTLRVSIYVTIFNLCIEIETEWLPGAEFS